MKGNFWIYLAVMSAVTFAVRVLPLTLIRKQIKNTFIRSFLYYVPYVTLSVMVFPAIIYATGSVLAGALALAVGMVLAYIGADMFKVSVACCAVALIIGLVV